MSFFQNPGLIIKQRREKLGLSIRELARRTGLSASFISQLERGKSNVSLESLGKISEQLELTIKDFFLDKDPLDALVINQEDPCPEDTFDGEYTPVVRAGCRPRLVFPNSGVSYELLMNDLTRNMESVYGRISPGTGNIARRLRKPTEEFIFVISGSLKVVLKGKTYTIHQGDSIYFEGYDMEELSCASEVEDAIWISVITPPIF
jgi:transcriptional regulator with XRE-family HTH domain